MNAAETPRAVIILNSRKESEKKAATVRKAMEESGLSLRQIQALLPDWDLQKEYGACVSQMIYESNRKQKLAEHIEQLRAKSGGLTDQQLDAKHQAVMEQKRAEHAEATKWMEHITPLHLHKQRLEAEIEKRQEALDKARAEYRNFLATLGQLMEESK